MCCSPLTSVGNVTGGVLTKSSRKRFRKREVEDCVVSEVVL